MDELVRFGSPSYCLYLILLVMARGMDFLSTWIATPNLVVEGNPIAKKMGWKLAIPFNLLICLVLAAWPLPAVMITTTSALLAARNLQSAWLIHTVGEERYFVWMADRLRETSPGIYLFCVFAQAAMVASVGGALVLFGDWRLVPFAIGWGMIGYALVVAFYTLFSMWRLRRPLG